MIAIVDYGMGNLRSVQKALERAGADARVVRTPAEIAAADKIVLPGVGAFEDAIAHMRADKLDEPLIRAAATGVPMMGMCLGLQMMFDVSYEDGEHRGLGIFAGKVVRFSFPPDSKLCVPHMGWNSLAWTRPCPNLAGVPQGSYAYFAHSYHVMPEDPGIACTTTDYGYAFTSSVWKGNIFATQFHPEKSQAIGLKILENFVRL